MAQLTVTLDYPDDVADRFGVRDVAETLAARLTELYPGTDGDVLPLGLAGGPALVIAATSSTATLVYRVEPDGLRQMPGDNLAFALEVADDAADAVVHAFGSATGCNPEPVDAGLLIAAAALVPLRLRTALAHDAEVAEANGS